MDRTAPEDENEGDSVRRAWRTIAPLMDLITPMALRAAATLRLADLIADGSGQIDDLARRSETDPDALGRILRHLVRHGVFTESEPGHFGLNDIAELLRSGHPAELRRGLDLDGFGGTMDLAFTGLLHTVRTGEPAWETVFGAPFWPYLAAHPQMGASFDANMSSSAALVTDEAGGYDWSAVRHVTDVGGGTGALIAEVLEAHPGVRATLVDLPATAGRGREFLAARGLTDRCEVVGQSFFDPLPAGSDVYVLRRVVHDWDDTQARAILRRCVEAAGERGRVIVIEGHGTSGDDPEGFAEMDLRMLVFAGGRERSLDEYSALAASSGLHVASVHTTPLGHVILDCVPQSAAATGGA
ncbi:methyltransferase [Streptomyces sp. RKAG293]|uniref:methyltransferase n=1 Tax=Streptomyces sp. RKAG293 TaxID=2893403 RepID=UPI0020345AE5|nr:methyltransferase [Streptomyces sp. RKAG293]MCM2423799.1 methyltransferase [Streptomyces sp. RKAG293]